MLPPNQNGQTLHFCELLFIGINQVLRGAGESRLMIQGPDRLATEEKAARTDNNNFWRIPIFNVMWTGFYGRRTVTLLVTGLI